MIMEPINGLEMVSIFFLNNFLKSRFQKREETMRRELSKAFDPNKNVLTNFFALAPKAAQSQTTKEVSNHNNSDGATSENNVIDDKAINIITLNGEEVLNVYHQQDLILNQQRHLWETQKHMLTRWGKKVSPRACHFHRKLQRSGKPATNVDRVNTMRALTDNDTLLYSKVCLLNLCKTSNRLKKSKETGWYLVKLRNHYSVYHAFFFPTIQRKKSLNSRGLRAGVSNSNLLRAILKVVNKIRGQPNWRVYLQSNQTGEPARRGHMDDRNPNPNPLHVCG